MKYQVNPYLIYELKKEQTTIIQTKESSFATKNSFLINFLNFLEENSIDLISYTDMKVFLMMKNHYKSRLIF